MACYAAIGIIVTIFIFPETMNHALLGSTSELLGLIKSFIELQNALLESPLEDLTPKSPLIAKLAGIRSGIVAKFQGSEFFHLIPTYRAYFCWQWLVRLNSLRSSLVMEDGVVTMSKAWKNLCRVSSVVSVSKLGIPDPLMADSKFRLHPDFLNASRSL